MAILYLIYLDLFFLNGYDKSMTDKEIAKELAQLKKQRATCLGTMCNVYGKNETSIYGRINGCCTTPQVIKQSKKGFTLLELLIVTLMIVILASIAWAQYLKAVERSRMSEVVALLANISHAQERKLMQTNRFASSYGGLDVVPQEASGNKYCTKGPAVPSTYTNNACAEGNGFVVQLSSATTYDGGKATALRSAPRTLQYQYELERYYANYGTLCTALNNEAKELCADFCGIDEYTTPCCTIAGNTIAEGDNACGVPSNNLHGLPTKKENKEE